jgi:hypothetical protein
MDIESLYERWRDDRSRAEPSTDFADRVMHTIADEPSASDGAASPPVNERSRILPFARAAACAAAALAALLRVIELLSVFSATGIEN